MPSDKQFRISKCLALTDLLKGTESFFQWTCYWNFWPLWTGLYKRQAGNRRELFEVVGKVKGAAFLNTRLLVLCIGMLPEFHIFLGPFNESLNKTVLSCVHKGCHHGCKKTSVSFLTNAVNSVIIQKWKNKSSAGVRKKTTLGGESHRAMKSNKLLSSQENQVNSD